LDSDFIFNFTQDLIVSFSWNAQAESKRFMHWRTERKQARPFGQSSIYRVSPVDASCFRRSAQTFYHNEYSGLSAPLKTH
jgi:hypothetical protein